MHDGDGWRLGHRPGLDQLRGVAVLMVVLGHTIHRWGVGGAGHIGVTIFFVLSGFLITRLLVEERDDTGGIALGAFYARRARRLLPALLVFLPLAVLVNLRLHLLVAEPLAATLAYVVNYTSVHDGIRYGAFTHLWSLAVEEHFYLVWPSLVLLIGRRRLVPVCLAVIAAVAYARYATSLLDTSLALRATHLRVDAMLVGAVLAVAVARLPRPPKALSTGAAGVLVVACHGSLLVPLLGWGFVVVELAAAVLVLDALRWRRRAWLAHIGVISYGMYLFHLPIGLWLGSRGTHEAALPVLTLVLTIAVAEVSYRLIEEPIRRRGRRARSAREPQPAIG